MNTNVSQRIALTLALVAVGCGKGSIAELVQGERIVDGEKKGSWVPVDQGTKFFAGEAVRTGAMSTARLGFAGGKILKLGEKSRVRFVVDSQQKLPTIGVEFGQADIEGEGPLLVATGRGNATLDPGTRLHIEASPSGVKYEVLVGRALFSDGAIGAGQGFFVAIGGATFERYQVSVGLAKIEPLAPKPSAAPAAVPEPTPEAAPPAQAAAPPPDDEDIHGTDYRVADVNIPSGESPTIHDRHNPVLVRVAADLSCAAGFIEVTSGARKPRRFNISERGAVVPLSAGTYKYRALCAGDGQLRTGTLTVRRDPGTSPVPKTAPTNVIDADGRKYTVLYQNRLPALTFTWPRPPQGVGFKLMVRSGERVREVPVRGPRHILQSGAVAEGEHQFWFTMGAVTSPQTTLAVRFDNAAATAQLQTPVDGTAFKGNAIEVTGVAMEGSTVTVSGLPLAVDSHGRFRGEVPAPENGLRSMAIKLAHPRSGIHYYVRRGTVTR